ncbi:glycerophosphodiester phosphodiesterase, partial [Moniliophthora roreri]
MIPKKTFSAGLQPGQLRWIILPVISDVKARRFSLPSPVTLTLRWGSARRVTQPCFKRRQG